MTLSRPFAAGSASLYLPSHSTHEAFSHTGLSNARRLTSRQLFYGKKSSKEQKTWVTAVDRPQQDMCVCLNIRNTNDRIRRVLGMHTSLQPKTSPTGDPSSAGEEPGRAGTHPGRVSSPACVVSVQLPTSAGPQPSSVKWVVGEEVCREEAAGLPCSSGAACHPGNCPWLLDTESRAGRPQSSNMPQPSAFSCVSPSLPPSALLTSGAWPSPLSVRCWGNMGLQGENVPSHISCTLTWGPHGAT